MNSSSHALMCLTAIKITKTWSIACKESLSNKRWTVLIHRRLLHLHFTRPMRIKLPGFHRDKINQTIALVQVMPWRWVSSKWDQRHPTFKTGRWSLASSHLQVHTVHTANMTPWSAAFNSLKCSKDPSLTQEVTAQWDLWTKTIWIHTVTRGEGIGLMVSSPSRQRCTMWLWSPTTSSLERKTTILVHSTTQQDKPNSTNSSTSHTCLRCREASIWWSVILVRIVDRGTMTRAKIITQ